MVRLTTSERTTVEGLVECIAEAMSRLDDVDPKYANKTKLQKLLYLAIDEFDLPVTYSWYLAGAVVPGDSTTPSDLQSTFDDLPNTETPTVTPSEAEPVTDDDEPLNGDFDATVDASAEELLGVADVESATDDETAVTDDTNVDPILFTGAEPDDGANPTDTAPTLGERRAEIVDFYVSTIPEVWKQNTMRFLQNFYLEHAPPAYRDLYVQSTHFRTRLREIETEIDRRLRGEQPVQPIPELVESAELDISDLHCTIRSSESLSPTFDGFVRGTDLIEDGLMMLAKQAPDDFEREHLTVVRSMQEFYYYYVWRYPCLVISQETATGPSAESLQASRRERITEFDEELSREAERFERELANAGLKPDYTDYPSSDDDVDETVATLADYYID